ncbi:MULTISPECIES: hypothetical protein [unclassified Psychrobacter]|uniref:hypothetical protein n=1 Tax=unclassified Psychrobacter TaxID=196806 RepID=UPI000EE50CDD|nr:MULTISPECIES: hypothetical protein [unclassified Psychrobacter]MBE8608753.1 hypothetical protein [Pseudomonas lundensis]HCI77109.1 hypothetical protein [Psychrobacter sp.]
MPTHYSLTLLAMGLIATNSAIAEIAESTQTYAAIKIATISNMYQQDVNNQGMDNPVVLQQYADPDLQAAMQIEQDYFDREQISCHVDYDVLWDSQDPDYAQDKQFSMTDEGLVQVILAHGSNVYYELSCNGTDDDANCRVAGVILDEDGKSLRKHLLETCR